MSKMNCLLFLLLMSLSQIVFCNGLQERLINYQNFVNNVKKGIARNNFEFAKKNIIAAKICLNNLKNINKVNVADKLKSIIALQNLLVKKSRVLILPYKKKRDKTFIIRSLDAEHDNLIGNPAMMGEEAMKGPALNYAILFVNQKHAGFIAYRKNFIQWIYVHPKFRKHGHAKRLMNIAIQNAKRLKHKHITAEIYNYNKSGLSLFKKLGFKKGAMVSPILIKFRKSLG